MIEDKKRGRPAIHWLEAKQLDRCTNFSTEIEILKVAKSNGYDLKYYCTYAHYKKDFGVGDRLIYLGRFRSRLLKALEFALLVTLRMFNIVRTERASVIMVSNHLIIHSLPSLLMNRVLNRQHKFVVDVRTTPTNPESFSRDMGKFHRSFRIAARLFDGFSFITPHMRDYVTSGRYNLQSRSVCWSSGVDVELFRPPKNRSDAKLSPESNVIKIFYHGGISVSRGCLDLVQACEELRERGYPLSLTQVGVVVGREIPDYIQKHDLVSWCKLLPPAPLEEVPPLIAQCDLPVIPFPDFVAWRVSSPLKMLEYMAMGKRALVPKMECFEGIVGEATSLLFFYEASAGRNKQNLITGLVKALEERCSLNQEPDHLIRSHIAQGHTWQDQGLHLLRFCEKL